MRRTPERELVYQLIATSRLLQTHVDRHARRYGTTRAQWSLLARLRREDNVTQTALARQLDLQPISLGRLVDSLEGRGFVERRPDVSDRRAYRLHLTDAGRTFVDRLDSVRQSIAEETLARLAPEEIAATRSVLDRIREQLLDLADDQELTKVV